MACLFTYPILRTIYCYHVNILTCEGNRYIFKIPITIVRDNYWSSPLGTTDLVGLYELASKQKMIFHLAPILTNRVLIQSII